MFSIGTFKRFSAPRKHETFPQFTVDGNLLIHGKSQTGKTHLLLTLLRQVAQKGYGFMYIDLHGSHLPLPTWRHKDVIRLKVTDTQFPLAFNPIKTAPEALHAVWKDSWGAQLEMFVTAACYALAETNGTLLGINRLLTDATFRKRIIGQVKDIGVKNFWNRTYHYMPDREQRERALSTLNKIGQLLTDPSRAFFGVDGNMQYGFIVYSPRIRIGR